MPEVKSVGYRSNKQHGLPNEKLLKLHTTFTRQGNNKPK